MFRVEEPDAIGRGRELSAQTYGRAFAEKASPRLINAMTQVDRWSLEGAHTFGLLAVGVPMGAGPAVSAVIGISPSEGPEVSTDSAAYLRHRNREIAMPTVAEVADSDDFSAESAVGNLLALKRARRTSVCAAQELEFLRRAQPIATSIERDIQRYRSFGAPVRVGRSYSMHALHVPAPLHFLAEVAHDDAVDLLDVSPTIELELNVTIPALRLRAFLATHGAQRAVGEIVVAVIDGEIDDTHPALRGSVVKKTNYTQEPWGNPHPHATAVAGIIASAGNPEGVAPGVTILNYKLFPTNPMGASTLFQGGEAIDRAAVDGADVMNLSWGTARGSLPPGREERACAQAWENGAVVVKSAGNFGSLTAPSPKVGTIVVGATDRQLKAVAPGSGAGEGFDRIGPDYLSPGGTAVDPITTTTLGGGMGDSYQDPVSGAASAIEGTSFAAAHMSGIVAQILNMQPGFEPDDLHEELANHAQLLAGVTPDVQGRGVVRF